MAKPLLIMVGSDKGGVGKTMVSRALSDYLASQGTKFRAFDTESPSGVLRRFNPRSTEIVDLTQVPEQMKVFDTLSSIPVTLIDVRAGLLTPTLKTLGEIGLFDMVKAGQVSLVVLHVLGPSMASLQEIAATSALMSDSKHFLVKNHINDSKFFDWDEVTTSRIFTDLKSGLIDIPRLDALAAEHLESASVTFPQFIGSENADGSPATYSMVLRGYARTWLKNVYAAFDGAKLNEIAASATI
jgi:Mrp family chromosome partitioning ATPase